MKLYKALHIVFGQFGKDMLGKETLINFLADYQAFDIKATRRVLQTFLQMGYGIKVLHLEQREIAERLLIIKSYAAQLAREGYQEVHVNYVLDSVCYALGWLDLPPEELDDEQIKAAANKRTIVVNGLSFTMIFVNGGIFDMGGTPEQGMFASFDEKPPLQTTVGNFYIAETQVVQSLWEEVMKDNPSHFKGENLPVERVSWDECVNFIDKLNSLTGYVFRMPTEAEWEFAARGGILSKKTMYSGASADVKDCFMWFKENSLIQTHDVACKSPNELGLYDMSGNVSEWCSDWYYNSYANNGSRINPVGPATGTAKVYRGGSWDDKAIACRVSKRNYMNPIYRNKLVGLRLAATIL